MMVQNKFTVIIPTRERANTLVHAIYTCVQQSYQNFDIIVSDNCSSDNTEEVVKSFNDPRIKYVNPGKRLSMAKNYEFALSHVTKGWACIIGDDDGLLPESIAKANEIANNNPDGDVLYWYHNVPRYFWGGKFGGATKDNTFYFRETHDYAPYIPKAILKKLMTYEASYETLPIIYHGFVHIDLINKVKLNSENNNFFQARIPDVYSTIALSYFSKKVIKCEVPISIQGISNNSIGESRIFKKTDLQTEKRFLTEADIPFHESLHMSITDNPMSNIYILVADAFLYFFDKVKTEYSDKKEDYKKFILLILAKKIREENDKNYNSMGIRIEQTNGLDFSDLETNSLFSGICKLRRYFYYIYSHKLKLHYCKTETITDVFSLYNSIIDLPLKERIKYKILKICKFNIRLVKYFLRIK